jgi:hypothetical protein
MHLHAQLKFVAFNIFHPAKKNKMCLSIFCTRGAQLNYGQDYEQNPCVELRVKLSSLMQLNSSTALSILHFSHYNGSLIWFFHEKFSTEVIEVSVLNE